MGPAGCLGCNDCGLARQGEDGVSDEELEAALRIRARLGFQGEGERGMFLCHTLCELGATPLEETLESIRDFLVTHPSDVLVVVNQDYVTSPDFVAAVEAAGLGDLVITPPADGPWPTLGELVARDRRVLFLAENEGGAAPWYQPVYERLTEETPYAFPVVGDLLAPAALPASCAPNRGPAEGAPLFLMNHWITTSPVPRPSDAARINAREALLARVAECERVRGRLPSLLAVNFYLEGDLFAVVDELNAR